VIISLDTNVMVDMLNGDRPLVRARYEAAVADGATIVTSALAAHELVYGAMISRRPEVHVPNAERLLADLDVIAWTYDDGVATARLRRALRRQGRTIGAIDALIAGQALAQGWTMVSANLREYGRVEGLDCLDWTAPTETL
jgi:tRNA(fMet)-specific endonuclease VapC